MSEYELPKGILLPLEEEVTEEIKVEEVPKDKELNLEEVTEKAKSWL